MRYFGALRLASERELERHGHERPDDLYRDLVGGEDCHSLPSRCSWPQSWPLTLRAGTAHAAPFNVVNTNDSGPGSLRTAILRANANANPSDQDNINFDIPAAPTRGATRRSGVCTISPASALPEITEPVIIDGYTQSGASPTRLLPATTPSSR